MIEESTAFPRENFRLLHEAGLLALTAPIELRGCGAGLATTSEVIQIIARGEPSTTLILIMQYISTSRPCRRDAGRGT
ncbi:acyl-CoA dehydrogenase family protein [Bradyrhizobium sp. Arg314]